jgi:hypothetical protein
LLSQKGSKKAKNNVHFDNNDDSCEETMLFEDPFTTTIAQENDLNLKPAAPNSPAIPPQGNPKESSSMAKDSVETQDITTMAHSLSNKQDKECHHSHKDLEEIDNLYYTPGQIKKRGKAPVEHCAQCKAVFYSGRMKLPSDVLKCKVEFMKPVYACRGAKDRSCDYGICWICYNKTISNSERNTKPPIWKEI